jgi:hypothetical protein
MRPLYVDMAHVENNFTTTLFRRIKWFPSACVIGYAERDVKKLRMAKSKKNKNKGKLNLTVREEQRNKLEQLALARRREIPEVAVTI